MSQGAGGGGQTVVILRATFAVEKLAEWCNPAYNPLLGKISSYNSAFQMNSFAANDIDERRFRPTFRIQIQVYYLIGSILPQQGEEIDFLRIHLMGNEEEEHQ